MFFGWIALLATDHLIGRLCAETFAYLCEQVQSAQAAQPAHEHIVMDAAPPAQPKQSACC